MANFLRLCMRWLFNALDIIAKIITALLTASHKTPGPDRRRRDNEQPPRSHTYKRTTFLTPAELNFYRVLLQTDARHMAICPKVRIADIIEPANFTHAALNAIAQKHADFVLCDPHTMTPIAAIELDDKSHNTDRARHRDETVHNAYTTAGLPLLRFPARRQYTPTDINAQLAALAR